MDSDRRQVVAYAILGFVLTFSAIAGAATISNTFSVTGESTLQSNNGLVVTVTGSPDQNFEAPWPDNDTVEVVTESGNATFQSSGSGAVTVDKTEIEGTWTNVSGIDATSNDITINPADKQSFTAGKDIDRIEFRDAGIDNGQVDFVYAGSSGESKVVVNGLQANTQVGAVDATHGGLLDVTTTDGSGTATFTSLDNSEHAVALETSDGGPSLDNSSMDPDGNILRPENNTLSIDVTDPDVPDDNVTLRWYVDGNLKNTTYVTSNGTHSAEIGLPADGTHDWHVEAEDKYNQTDTSATKGFTFDYYDPVVSNVEPQNILDSKPDQISADINDKDFAFGGDNLTVKIDLDGSQIHSETISNNGTVTTSMPDDGKLGGEHELNITVDDYYGESTDETSTYKVPSNITFRAEQPKHAIIENGTTVPITVEATFFEDVESAPTIINKTTTSGNITLGGLPVASEFSVSVSAPGYHNRTVRLESIFEQRNIFLIKKGAATTVENRFIVNDRTGNFPADRTEISIQAPINQSLYDTGGFTWITVSGDDLGADESYVDDVIEEKRYRIVVENDEGDTRVLGAYTPETTGTVELNIGDVRVNPDESGGVAMNATWYNATGTERVRIEYNDTVNATQTLYVNVYERNNESNTLMDNQSFGGPFGTFSHTQNVPAGEEDTNWVVEVVGDRSTNDGGEEVENVHFKELVGPNANVLNSLPGWIVTVLFVGLIWVVAGLFSQVNGHVGGIVVAGLGGMLHFVGLVPDYLGGGVVGLALLTAGILFVRESRGGAI